MMKTKVFIFLLIICSALLAVVLFFRSMQSRSEVYNYLPQLKSHELKNIKVKKIYADPSYLVPYNVLMTFKSDDKTIIEELGLKTIEAVDTIKLKKSSWVEEYNLYFSMNSVNAVRYPSIKKQIDDIRWWEIVQCSLNYAAPYFDSNDNKSIVAFNQKNNGRIICCRKGNVYFILIECWG